jgi:hypothetical protein
MSNIGGKSYVGKEKSVPYGSGPAAEKTLSNNSGATNREKAGLATGLTDCSPFDSENWGPTFNYEVNPITGNSAGDIQDNPEVRKVSEKGQTFVIC